MNYFKLFLAVLLGLAFFQISLRAPVLPIEPVRIQQNLPTWKAKIWNKIEQKKAKTAAPRSQDYKIRTQLSAFLLCLFFGFLGVHRFYTGHYAIAVLQLLTFGCCGFFWIADLLFICFNLLPTAWGEKLVSWNYTALDDKQKIPLRVD